MTSEDDGPPVPERTSRARRGRVAVVVLVAGVVGVVAAAAAWSGYVTPDVDELSVADPVDAVVALGGVPETAERAHAMAVAGLATEVVVSNPYDPGNHAVIDDLCGDPPPGPTVTCFAPDPATTRGEARAIRDLAVARGWETVAVTTPTYHLSRAEFIVRRCYAGDLRMVDPSVDIDLDRWVYHVAYQTGGFAKALTQRGC